ncbi:MAG: T9SS type A sorting domain-containing protein [Bacteroidota bacterium]
MKHNLTLIYLLVCMSVVHAQLSNGDFETFGAETFDIFERQGSMFNPATCQVDGGTVMMSGTRSGSDRPEGFRTTDDFFNNNTPRYVSQTTDANGGSSAVQLTSDAFGFGVIGQFGVETLVQETLPVPYTSMSIPTSIDGFYKHTSGNPRTIRSGTCTSGGVLDADSTFSGGFAVYAQFYDAMDNVIAEVDTVFPDAAAYTAFSARVRVLTPGATATTYVFIMAACPEFLSPNLIALNGSETFIDDVSFNFTPLSNDLYLDQGPTLTVFPNPAASTLQVATSHRQPSPIQLLDVHGKTVFSGILYQELNIDLSMLSPGMYVVKCAGINRRVVIR